MVEPNEAPIDLGPTTPHNPILGGPITIGSLLPYALVLERHDQREMLNMLSRLAMTPRWDDIRPFTVSKGANGDVVQYIQRVRALGDLEVLKSYLLLLWSGQFQVDDWSGALTKMQISIQEDFGGIGMRDHREDLMKWLDRAPEQLDRLAHACIAVQPTKKQYEEFRRRMLEVDEEAVQELSCTPPWLICFNLLTPADAYRISPDLHVCPAPPVPITLRWEARRPPTSYHFICTLTPVIVVAFHCTHRHATQSKASG